MGTRQSARRGDPRRRRHLPLGTGSGVLLGVGRRRRRHHLRHPRQDFIWATRGDDVVNGVGGDDVIFGGAGDDSLYGGPANSPGLQLRRRRDLRQRRNDASTARRRRRRLGRQRQRPRHVWAPAPTSPRRQRRRRDPRQRRRDTVEAATAKTASGATTRTTRSTAARAATRSGATTARTRSGATPSSVTSMVVHPRQPPLHRLQLLGHQPRQASPPLTPSGAAATTTTSRARSATTASTAAGRRHRLRRLRQRLPRRQRRRRRDQRRPGRRPDLGGTENDVLAGHTPAPPWTPHPTPSTGRRHADVCAPQAAPSPAANSSSSSFRYRADRHQGLRVTPAGLGRFRSRGSSPVAPRASCGRRASPTRRGAVGSPRGWPGRRLAVGSSPLSERRMSRTGLDSRRDPSRVPGGGRAAAGVAVRCS